MIPQKEGVKLVRPIPQRNIVPLPSSSQINPPVAPLGISNSGTNIGGSGFDNSLPMGAGTLPINNLIYLLNQQSAPTKNLDGNLMFY